MSSQEINEILNAINVLYDEHSKKKKLLFIIQNEFNQRYELRLLYNKFFPCNQIILMFMVQKLILVLKI